MRSLLFDLTFKPFSEGGDNDPANGLLLRRDIHALFDGGYVTVTPDLKFRVSRRIKEEFENGRHYYAFDGQTVAAPTAASWSPNPEVLKWHSTERFRG
jgi:putative restriction endonuclease